MYSIDAWTRSAIELKAAVSSPISRDARRRLDARVQVALGQLARGAGQAADRVRQAIRDEHRGDDRHDQRDHRRDAP